MEGVTVTINDRAPGEAVQITPPRQSNGPLLLEQGVLVRNENDVVVNINDYLQAQDDVIENHYYFVIKQPPPARCYVS